MTMGISLSVTAQQYRALPAWQYRAVNQDFWDDFEAAMKAKKLNAAIDLVIERQEKAKSLERVELELAMILIMQEKGQTVLAFHRALSLVERAPGSMPALQAWSVINQLAQSEDFDLKEMQRLANIGNFNEAPADLISLFSYLIILENKDAAKTKWARSAVSGLDSESYWGVLYDMQKFVVNLQVEPSEQDLAAWRKLMQRAEKYPRLRTKMRLQEARFLQSLQQSAEALEIYISMGSNGREFGREMFERAWNLYNLKQYSSSLGLLQTLKSSSMRMAIEPEIYILAMVAYRDLCHYPAVHIMRTQYLSVFGSTLEQIKAGAPLEDMPILAHLVAQTEPWSLLANEITLLKVQVDSLSSLKPFPENYMVQLNAESKELEKNLVQRLKLRSRPELQHQAERLIALTEQMQLLEYISDLQEFKLSPTLDDRTYRSEQAKASASNGLFWAVDGEDWKDDLGTFKVLVSDRCPVRKRGDQK
jgi:hypothetical protein